MPLQTINSALDFNNGDKHRQNNFYISLAASIFNQTKNERPMSKEQTKDLLKFLKPFSSEIQKTVLKLREFVWDIYPQTNELIYDNYNAVAFGWSPTDKVGHTFCSIAIGRTVRTFIFGFYWGSEIDDPEKILLGQGNQYRYILVDNVPQVIH